MKEEGPDLTTLRSVLLYEPLTDAEVRFLHQALERSGLEFTQKGLLTFAEWELYAEVTIARDGRWSLTVAGPQVDWAWDLYVDRETGEVEDYAISTVLPIPDPPGRRPGEPKNLP